MRKLLACLSLSAVALLAAAQESVRLLYNNPGLQVDLGVGLWAQPFPMDYDGDGDSDLVVATADKPSNGIYFFENGGGEPRNVVLEAGKRLGPAQHNISVSYLTEGPVLTTPGKVYPAFRSAGWDRAIPIDCEVPTFEGKTRADQWKFVDYEGDGDQDLVIAIGYWGDYGWDDAYNDRGEWTNGPLHGYVYLLRNEGTDAAPRYGEPAQIQTAAGPVDTYGCPSPNFADFDRDGDLDLLCGEFLDRLMYFENTGTRSEPVYAAGRFLTRDGAVVHMDLQMLQVCAYDWDNDGWMDIVVGEEDGRVAILEHTGRVRDGLPQFLKPRFFRQQAEYLKVGALSTPYGCDWDGDGDEDLIVGDTAGYLSFVENLDGGDPPMWERPRYLEADGEIIRIQAGPNGSIQGPCEAKWGYTVPNVADWNNDGLLDIVINSIWGKVLWYENVGEPGAPRLAAAKAIEVEWDGPTPKPAWFWWNPEGKELVTQWRTTPIAKDLNGDGLVDLSMLDQEGYLVFFERAQRGDALVLLPPTRIFQTETGDALRLNERNAGGSGRRKLALADWDNDGKLDLLVNSDSISWYRNISDDPSVFLLKEMGKVDARVIGGHSTCPSIVDWDKNGIPDLVAGAEDGFFYYLKNPLARP